jgi:hypothetical protein
MNNIKNLQKIPSKYPVINRIVLVFFLKNKISINATNVKLYIAKNAFSSFMKVIARFNKAIFKVLTLKNVQTVEYGFKSLLDVNTSFANVRHLFAINVVMNLIEILAEKVIYGKCKIR